MSPEFRKYKSGFRNLAAWREAHALTLLVYKATAAFPATEKFAMADQLRRAASSVGANIAEGSSRHTLREQRQFYWISKGSLSEVDNFLELANDLQFISNDLYVELLEKVNKAGYLLNRLLGMNQNVPTEPNKPTA